MTEGNRWPPDSLQAKLFPKCVELYEEVMECGEVPRISVDDITPDEFHRSFVALNRPCILTGAFSHWNALKKWSARTDDSDSPSYLTEVLGDQMLEVDWTPTGKGDCLYTLAESGETVFIRPKRVRMTMEKLLSNLNSGHSDSESVYYLSAQNDNFRTEYTKLFDDCDLNGIPFARSVFRNAQPDAVNLWIGGSDATTTMHKDPYENFYCVVSGMKRFTLLPPQAMPMLHTKWAKCGEFTDEDHASKSHVYGIDGTSKYAVDLDDPSPLVPWIEGDVEDPLDISKSPSMDVLRPQIATVWPGETLYLPSIWYHTVRQADFTIAVNYWWDMDYGPSWSYFRFLESIYNEPPVQ